MALLTEAWSVLLALGPWLLLGALVAGVLHVALPPGFVHRELSGRLGVLKAVALGVPLPLCSCGVIPAALGLRRDGADRGATVGFLVSTPQTGVDSVLVSASFLGWPFAIFKVLAAAVTGVVGGYLAGTVTGDAPNEGPEADAQEQTVQRSFAGMVEHSLSILRTIWHWIAIGVFASAAIGTWVPPGSFEGLGSVASMLAVLAVSVPLYVCATGSVPIAAALVAGGLPAGSALVFLMAGPATNVATIGAVYRALGSRTLAIYLGTIIVGSVAAGLLFDSLLPAGSGALPGHHGEALWWETASAVVLSAMLLWFALSDLRALMAGKPSADHAQSIEMSVAGMTCNGCRSKLERALIGTDGVDAAVVILEPGSARIWGSLDTAGLQRAVSEAGFTPLAAADD